MGAELSEFLERYAETQFRYSAEILPSLLSGRARCSVRPVDGRALLSTYTLREGLLRQRTSSYWRSIHQAVVELCEGLQAAPDAPVRGWSIVSGDTATDFDYAVFESVDPPKILTCFRFPVVLSFAAERAALYRLRVLAGAAEFHRRAKSLISPQGRVRLCYGARDGVEYRVDADIETDAGTDSLWLKLPYPAKGDGELVVRLRADEDERR